MSPLKRVALSPTSLIVLTLLVWLGSTCLGSKDACGNDLTPLMNCAPAVSSGSKVTPSKACCNAIGFYKNKIQCLCNTLVGLRNNLPKQVDLNKALSLPKRCNYGRFAPPNYKCAGYTIP